MRKSRSTAEQIVAIVREAESGTRPSELCRRIKGQIMINDVKRRAAISLIEQYRDGQITNRELETSLDELSHDVFDRELRHICDRLWYTYDDLLTHRAVAPDSLRAEEVALIQSCLAELRQGL